MYSVYIEKTVWLSAEQYLERNINTSYNTHHRRSHTSANISKVIV